MFNGTKDPWKAKGAEIKSQWERCEDKWEQNKESKITLCCIRNTIPSKQTYINYEKLIKSHQLCLR